MKSACVCVFRTWRKLQRVLSNWLATTGIEEETEERESVLKELSEVSIYLSFFLSFLHTLVHKFTSLNMYSKGLTNNKLRQHSWFLRLHYRTEDTGGLHLTRIFLANLRKPKSKCSKPAVRSVTRYIFIYPLL